MKRRSHAHCLQNRPSLLAFYLKQTAEQKAPSVLSASTKSFALFKVTANSQLHGILFNLNSGQPRTLLQLKTVEERRLLGCYAVWLL
jgi:hypothetical protein